MESKKFIKPEFCFSEKQIRGASPEVLFDLIHTVKESLKQQISTLRLTTNAEMFHKDMKDMQAEYGYWSSCFNQVLRQIIHEHSLFESDMMLYKLKRFNMCYLYWWKCVQYLEIMYLPLLQIPGKKLKHAVQLMDETRDHFLGMKYEEPIIPKMMGGQNGSLETD